MTNADFWQTLLENLGVAYAFFDADRRLRTCAPFFAEWICPDQTDLIGAHLFDLIPEFFGQHLDPDPGRSGTPVPIQLNNVNRTSPTGETHYYTLMAMADPAAIDATLAVIVTDVTDQGRYAQGLMQNHNELRLLRRKLSQLNEQLDFLLKHYLAPDIAEALLKGELRPELGGVLREVTILFADARDFTTIAESLPAERVMTTLNNYLSVIVDAIDHHGGTINQFQGDNVMAIFNTHNDQPDHAIRAVSAGIDLQKAVLAYQKLLPKDERRFHFGVGINTGSVILGNSGARWRYTYTAIGDATNLAARITSAVPAYEVWISRSTYAQIKGTFEVVPLSPVQFKGKGYHTGLFRVLADLASPPIHDGRQRVNADAV